LTLHLIGYWRASLTDDYPLPQHLEYEVASDVRECVATYLESGAPYEQYRGSSWCRFGCTEDNGSAELHDGTWVWPSGLAHYVRVHGIKLPDEFVQHVLKNASVPRSAFDTPTEGRASDDSFWRDWATQYRCPEFELAARSALNSIPAQVISALEEIAANLARERGVGDSKCLRAGCGRVALPDMAFCANCLAESRHQDRLRSQFEQEAFGRLLDEMTKGGDV
jgi:hypothetical protein